MSVSVPWTWAIVPLKAPAAGDAAARLGRGRREHEVAELTLVSVPAALRLAFWVALAAGPAAPSKLLVPAGSRPTMSMTPAAPTRLPMA